MLFQFKKQLRPPGTRSQLEEGCQRHQQQHIRHHVPPSKKTFTTIFARKIHEKYSIINNSSTDDVFGQDDRITSSIVHASNKVNLDLAKIVANSYPPLSNDTINKFMSSQKACHDDTPLRSNIVVIVDDRKSIAKQLAKHVPVIPLDDIENDSDLSVGMPHLLTRHDDNISIDSDESHYFQDDKANIAEWLEADDDESVRKAQFSVSLQADDKSIVTKSSNVQDTITDPLILPST